MKKKCFFVAAATVLLAASCSNEEIVEQSQGQKIAFNVLSQNAIGRGTPITSANFATANRDFKVWAFTTAEKYIQGVQIKYDGAKWDYANAAEKAYWPTQALNVFAISPAVHTGLTPGFGVISARNFTYTASTTNSEQVDVMYASKLNVTKTSDAGTVPLVFKHALSQIVFKGKAEAEAVKVRIKSIKVHNLKKTGTFTFPTAETATSSAHGTWALTGDATADYVVGTKVDTGQDHIGLNTLPSNAGQTIDLTTDNGALLIIPQTTTAWATTTTTAVPIATAETNKQCYLEIEMKLLRGGLFVIGSATDYAKVYVPFGGIAWEAGKKYIYTLNFGGGYDDAGNVMLQPMTFTPTVEDWVDAPKDTTLP